MINNSFFTFLIFLFGWSSPVHKSVVLEQVTIPFYTETISIKYAPEIIIPTIKKLEEEDIVRFYKQLERTPYLSVLTAFRTSQRQYALSDWLLYELVKKTIKDIYKKKPRSYQVLATWFFMSKLNYDTRLAFLGNSAYLYVKTKDNIYETPMIEEKGNRFLGLTELQYKRTNDSKGIYLLNFLAAPRGKSFSLAFTLPTLRSAIEKKDFVFQWRSKKYKVSVEVDKTLVAIMKHYPIIDESGYITAPFSKHLERSLLSQLKRIIGGKPLKQQVEILTSFTRSAFNYKEDESYFGRSKPMIREEVFHYPYSDCEDRTAVLYGLVDELLHLPMLVIAFSDHLTLAVAFKESIGAPIKHKGRSYYICDPTGPNNSSNIGYAPKGYERQAFEILLAN